jgi:UDP-N-acetylglucosamine--N-acetylmuramyl-(pentapeptide) pyrophosphoryl-undecaprenol N-acetylglucosamine transferase
VSQSTYAIVTGGGTSGHVVAALSVADALLAHDHPRDEIHYVGTTRGVERRLVPPTGYPHTCLDVVGLQRSLTTRNLAFVPKLIRSTYHAVRLVRRLRPKVVVNVGGYASFPATAAALLLRVPIVIVSYDRRPGLVSRTMARFATASAVAYEGSTLPRAEVTGAPVRREVIAVDRRRDRDTARATLRLPHDRFVIGVVGGSLGAQRINEVISAAMERWSDRRDLAIYHIVGERNLPSSAPARDGGRGIMYRVVGYEDRMPVVYAAADLMVTRAGAATVAELAVVGMPAIVVPWPGAAHDHQVDNARELRDRGAAVLVPESEFTVERLIAEVERLIAAPDVLDRIGTEAAAAGERHRGGALVAMIERVARR